MSNAVVENNQVTVDMSTLPKIIAVDFDGTLVSDDYPRIGSKNYRAFADMALFKNMGYKFILWTCRTGKALDEAVEYCREQGVVFDAVNKNLPEVIAMFGEDTRKVYADQYWDDKAVTP